MTTFLIPENISELTSSKTFFSLLATRGRSKFFLQNWNFVEKNFFWKKSLLPCHFFHFVINKTKNTFWSEDDEKRGRQCRYRATLTMQLQWTCDAPAMHLQCTCDAPAMDMQCLQYKCLVQLNKSIECKLLQYKSKKFKIVHVTSPLRYDLDLEAASSKQLALKNIGNAKFQIWQFVGFFTKIQIRYRNKWYIILKPEYLS